MESHSNFGKWVRVQPKETNVDSLDLPLGFSGVIFECPLLCPQVICWSPSCSSLSPNATQYVHNKYLLNKLLNDHY